MVRWPAAAAAAVGERVSMNCVGVGVRTGGRRNLDRKLPERDVPLLPARVAVEHTDEVIRARDEQLAVARGGGDGDRRLCA
eukprot:1035158-Pleurochrysis_carterae.AAC.2